MVVVEDVANALVEHGEEGGEGSETCEVHDVVQINSMLETAIDQSIQGKERLQHGCHITLDLDSGRHILVGVVSSHIAAVFDIFLTFLVRKGREKGR